MKKYTVWAIDGDCTVMYCYSLTNNKRFHKFRKVAETETVARAKEIISNLGWITKKIIN